MPPKKTELLFPDHLGLMVEEAQLRARPLEHASGQLCCSRRLLSANPPRVYVPCEAGPPTFGRQARRLVRPQGRRLGGPT